MKLSAMWKWSYRIISRPTAEKKQIAQQSHMWSEIVTHELIAERDSA